MNAGAESVCVATASKDRTLRLWKVIKRQYCLFFYLIWSLHPLNYYFYSLLHEKIHTEASLNSSVTIRAFKILRGHKASVQSVSVRSAGDMVLSIPWYHCIVKSIRIKPQNWAGFFLVAYIRSVLVLGIVLLICGTRRSWVQTIILWQWRREKLIIKLRNLKWRYCFFLDYVKRTSARIFRLC